MTNLMEISQKDNLTYKEVLVEYAQLLEIDEKKSNVGFYNKVRDRMNYLKDIIVEHALAADEGLVLDSNGHAIL